MVDIKKLKELNPKSIVTVQVLIDLLEKPKSEKKGKK